MRESERDRRETGNRKTQRAKKAQGRTQREPRGWCVAESAWFPWQCLLNLCLVLKCGNLLGPFCMISVGIMSRYMLSAPNHTSQTASDLKLRSPDRKNFPDITWRWGQDCAIRITTFVISSCQDAVIILIRIINRKCNQIVRFGALRLSLSLYIYISIYIVSGWGWHTHIYSHCHGRGFLMFIFI